MKALKTTLALLVLIIPNLISAQPTFGSGGICDTCPPTPIDKAINLLALLGLLYAVYKIKNRK